jgi:uncharacterized protein with PQ loop repeat
MLDLTGPSEVTAFAVIGNVLNLAYNIPVVYLVWKKRSSKNISGTFLTLRLCGSISWLIYAGLVNDMWIVFSYSITLISTMLITYIKCIERRNNKQPIEEHPRTTIKHFRGSVV